MEKRPIDPDFPGARAAPPFGEFFLPGHTANLTIGFGLLAAALFASVVLHLNTRDNLVDDAYITLRYAVNLASGDGFVFNPGERVLGTSSPLFALIQTAIAVAVPSAELAHAIPLMNLGIDLVIVVLVWALIYRWTGAHVIAGTAALLVGTNPRLIDYAAGGMEASFSVFLLALFAACVTSKRFELAGLVAGSLWLTRPESLLLAVPIALYGVCYRRNALRMLIAAAAVSMPWFLFASFYYGSPIPHSVMAKAAKAGAVDGSLALRYLLLQLSELLPFVSGISGGLRAPLWQLFAGAFPVAILLTVGARSLIRCHKPVTIVVVYSILYFLAFTVGNPQMLGWYRVTLAVAYAIALPVGLVVVCSPVFRRRSPTIRAVGCWTAAAIALIGSAAPYLQRIGVHPDPLIASVPFSVIPEYPKSREQAYRLVGETLSRIAAPGSRVAAPEIGALGYYYRGPIVDTYGLVSPSSLEYYPVYRNGRRIDAIVQVPPRLVVELRPEYIVSLELFLREGFLKDPEVSGMYRIWTRLPIDIFGSRGLWVLERKDLHSSVNQPNRHD